MTGKFQRLICTESGSISWVTLNRPEKRNALDDLTIQELKEAFKLAGENPQARIVALSGEGKDFCSGLDLSALQRIANANISENLEDARSMMELFLQMRGLPKPIVALVRGRALAGGCGLACACDLILASDTAQFGWVEVNIGFVAAIVMAILRRSVGEKRACELLVTGDVIGAERAERIGVVNRVFPDGEFDSRAHEWLEQLTGKSAPALRLTKQLLYQTDGMSLEQAMRCGVDVNAIARMTDDCRQGVAKFLERKK